jgi:hypothetical protein
MHDRSLFVGVNVCVRRNGVHALTVSSTKLPLESSARVLELVNFNQMMVEL